MHELAPELNLPIENDADLGQVIEPVQASG